MVKEGPSSSVGLVGDTMNNTLINPVIYANESILPPRLLSKQRELSSLQGQLYSKT